MTLLKPVVILMLLAILASLGSALVFLFRKHGGAEDSKRMVRALTWRIALSVTLFLLLMAGFYFDVISPHGLTK